MHIWLNFSFTRLRALFRAAKTEKDFKYFKLAKRYHKSRSVNDPDDPRFSLENLAHVFEELREVAK